MFVSAKLEHGMTLLPLLFDHLLVVVGFCGWRGAESFCSENEDTTVWRLHADGSPVRWTSAQP